MGSVRVNNLIEHEDPLVREALQVLDDFLIDITPEIIKRLEELSPNSIQIENYQRKLILTHLE